MLYKLRLLLLLLSQLYIKVEFIVLKLETVTHYHFNKDKSGTLFEQALPSGKLERLWLSY